MTDALGVLAHPTGRTATMDVSFICMEKSDLEKHSRALTSAQAPHRSYSLFDGCPPKCRPSSGHTLHAMLLSWSVFDFFID